jgi:hypothetical protein
MQSQRGAGVDGPMSRFSSEFQRALVRRYGRLPSAPFVAREFNLRHGGRKTISSESVRRWLHGDCLPHIDRLQTIFDWLDLRMDSVFSPGQGGESISKARHFSDHPGGIARCRTPDAPVNTGALSLSEEHRNCLRRLLAMLYPELNLEARKQTFSRGPV